MNHVKRDWPTRTLESDGYKLYFSILLLNLFWNGVSSADGFAPPVRGGPPLRYVTSTAQDPFACPLEKNQLRETPFFFLLALSVGATTYRKYLLLCGVMAAAVQIAFLCASVRKLGKENGVVASLLFLAHPVTYIMNTWLGMVDPVTVACSMVVLFTERPLSVLAAAALSMYNHPATIFIVPSLLALKFVAKPSAAMIPTLLG
jgi:hypothetical protein